MNKAIIYTIAVALLSTLGSAAHAQQQPSVQYYTPPSNQQQVQQQQARNLQAQQQRAEEQAEAQQQAEAERRAYYSQSEGELQAERMRESEARQKWEWDHPTKNWQTYGSRQQAGAVGSQAAPQRRPSIADQLRSRYNPRWDDYGKLLEDTENGVFIATFEDFEFWYAIVLFCAGMTFAYLWIYERHRRYEFAEGASEICIYFVEQNTYLEERANDATRRYNKLSERNERMEAALADAERKQQAALVAPAPVADTPIMHKDVNGDATVSDSAPSNSGSAVAEESDAESDSDKDETIRALTKRLENRNQKIRVLEERSRRAGLDAEN